MKILHIIDSLEIGSVGKFLIELIKIQRLNGMNIDILVLSMDNNYYEIDGLIYSKIDKKNYKTLFFIRDLIKKGGYNLIHAHLEYSQKWVALASYIDISQYLSKTKKRIYLTTEYKYKKNYKISKKRGYKISTGIYNRFSKIICVSNRIEESLGNILKMKNKGILITIEKGVVIEKNSELQVEIKRSEINVSESDILLVMISKLEDTKDHETLLKAMNLLPKKYKLLIVGEGSKKEKILKLGNELRLGNRLKIMNNRPDTEKILEISDISVLPSLNEEENLIILESMAAGTPIIMSGVEKTARISENNWLTFDRENPRDLAKKILELNRDDELRGLLIKKGKEIILKYSLDIIEKKYVSLYRGLLESAKS